MTIIPTHRLLAQPVRVVVRRPEGSIVQFMDGSMSNAPIPDHDMVAIPAHDVAESLEAVVKAVMKALEEPEMKRNIHCVDGRLWRHNPQPDDPECEIEVGECPDCSGGGCGDDGEAISKPGRSRFWLDPDRLRDDRDERRRLVKEYPDKDE